MPATSCQQQARPHIVRVRDYLSGGTMPDYRQLEVWKRAHALTLELYKMTNSFPKCEIFGLVSQIRRSSSSIGANLAEGCGRRGDAEFSRFIDIARGSCDELDYHLLLCFDLGYLQQGQYETARTRVVEIGKMLTGLSSRVRPRRNASVTRAPR